MKNSPVVFGLLSSVILCSFFSLPIALATGQRSSKPMTYEQRAANVKLQSLDHQHRVTISARESKSISSAMIPSGVSVQFNKLIKTSSTIFFNDDMESGTNGWTVPTPIDSAVWHRTILDANSPTYSWWPGVEERGDYVTGSRVYEELISPAINLTGANGNVTLLFTENYFTESGFDFCMIDATTDDGTSWTHLRGGYAGSPSGDSYGWKVTTLDLTPYANQTINLRFVFDTGDSLFNAFPGWFIDNVTVFDQSGIVNGIVYYDQNSNGIFDVGERGLKRWLITVTGPLTLTMQTTYWGTFSLPLPLGSYQFSEVLQTPWTQTSSPSTFSVDLNSPGQTVNDINFGNYRLGSLILGTVFNDLNKDSLFNPGEPPFMDPWIVLSDPNGYWVDGLHADSSGQLAFLVFGAGHYTMREYLPSHWISTIPPGRVPAYDIPVPPRDTVLSEFLFGSYELAPTNSAIRGLVFNDLNRNGALDDREPALQDRVVTLLDSIRVYSTTTLTDNLGMFSFDNLRTGKYTVGLQELCGWHQSVPALNYHIELDSGQVIDSVMFGSYALLTGSISGTVINDLDADAVRDEGEPTIGGSQINLSGTYCLGVGVVKFSTVSDDSGHYRFDGLWPGTYVVRIAMSAHWRQTYPTFLQPHTVKLGDEENRTGTDFGLTYDSTFNIAYRSFLPESIAYVRDNKGKLGKFVQSKPTTCDFQFTMPIYVGVPLTLKFSMTSSGIVTWGTDTIGTWSSAKAVIIPPIDTTGHGLMDLTVVGNGTRGKQVKVAYRWATTPNMTKGNITSFILNQPGLPMPNVMNVLKTMYLDGLPTNYGLTVGLVPGWHSAYASTALKVWKSLYQRGHMHLGPPRCLGIFATNLKPIKKSVNGLVPSMGNNILFAEALALKVNLFASDFGITPFGFGGLIFHGDSTNPFDGLSVRKIAAKLDTSMSKFDDNIKNLHLGGDTCLCDSNYFNTAYRTLRMIDSAFSGPFDTISFGPGLLVKPVRLLSDVPFLTLDSSFSSLADAIVPRIGSYVEEPLQYELDQNYPNPFNPATTISFTLAQESFVTLKIYNVLGQEVATLINREQMDEGSQEIEFNAANFSSGVYFYRILAEGISDEEGVSAQTFTQVKKMLLVK
jgi:hypothetical protein